MRGLLLASAVNQTVTSMASLVCLCEYQEQKETPFDRCRLAENLVVRLRPWEVQSSRPKAAFHLQLYPLNILGWDRPKEQAHRIPNTLLCKTTWQLIDQVASAGGRFQQRHQKKVKALRPEMVIVSTLQQLLSVPKLTVGHKRRVLWTLELVGGLIRDAARDGAESAQHWFDSKVWMYAVLLSAGAPENSTQAHCLYEAQALGRLLKLLNKAHEHGDASIFKFYQKLLEVSSLLARLQFSKPHGLFAQDTLELRNTGYDPRKERHVRVYFYRPSLGARTDDCQTRHL